MLHNRQQTLRCYTKREDTHWVAVCIDLSLAAQAESSEEAIEKLESMIVTYVSEALSKHKKYADQLLSRKAPFSQIFFYYKVLSLCFLRKALYQVSNNNGDNDHVFSEQYPTQTI